MKGGFQSLRKLWWLFKKWGSLLKGRVLRPSYELRVFWTPGLPEGVLSNRPCPSVCVFVRPCVCKYLVDRSLVFSETLHEVGGEIVSNELLKKFLLTHFFTFHIHISDAFLLNFLVVSYQLLKLCPFLGERCSQNDDFMVKTLHKCKYLK